MGTVRHGDVAAFKIRFDLAERRESGSISGGVQRLKRGLDMPDSRSSSSLKESSLTDDHANIQARAVPRPQRVDEESGVKNFYAFNYGGTLRTGTVRALRQAEPSLTRL